MSQEIVKVTEIADGGVWVEAVQRSACNSCNARSGCGQHSLSKLGRPMRLWVEGGEHLQPGQEVVLSIPAGGLAMSALLLYGTPLVGLIAGMAIGQTQGDALAGALGVTGLVAGFILARRISDRVKHRWEPRIVPGCTLIPQVEVK